MRQTFPKNPLSQYSPEITDKNVKYGLIKLTLISIFFLIFINRKSSQINILGGMNVLHKWGKFLISKSPNNTSFIIWTTMFQQRKYKQREYRVRAHISPVCHVSHMID